MTMSNMNRSMLKLRLLAKFAGVLTFGCEMLSHRPLVNLRASRGEECHGPPLKWVRAQPIKCPSSRGGGGRGEG